MARTPCFVLFALASACVTSSNSGGDDDGVDPPVSVAPKAGLWGYTDRTQVSSTCRSGVPGEGGNFQIDQSSVTGFRVVPGDSTGPFQCTLDRGAFSCPDRASAMQDYRPTLDAVVTVHATATGTFSSATRGSGRQDATVSCQGAACASVPGAVFPCNFSVSFAIAAQ